MTLIAKYIFNMFPYMFYSLPLILIFRIIRVYFLKKDNIKTNVWHEVGLCFFLVFLIGLASQTILCDIPTFSNFDTRYLFTPVKINLIPLKVFSDTYIQVFYNKNILYFTINFIGNIVMFMPLGFFPPLLWKKQSLKKTLLFAFTASLFIEICQLPLSRETDIDDLWLNTLGALLGYLIFLFFNKVCPSIIKNFKIISTN